YGRLGWPHTDKHALEGTDPPCRAKKRAPSAAPKLTIQEHETPLAPRPEKCRRLNPRKLTTGCLVERDSPRQFQHGAAHIRMWASVEDEQSEEVGSFGSLPARYPRACRAADRPGLSTERRQ